MALRVIGNQRNLLKEMIDLCNQGLSMYRDYVRTYGVLTVLNIVVVIFGVCRQDRFWTVIGLTGTLAFSLICGLYVRECIHLRRMRFKLCTDLMWQERIYNHEENEREWKRRSRK